MLIAWPLGQKMRGHMPPTRNDHRSTVEDVPTTPTWITTGVQVRIPPGQTPSPEQSGGAPFPQRFRLPANVMKYTGDTNPGVWLEDYRLACRAGGASDDHFIIQYLPICLGENVRAWLDFLPADSIGSWADLRKVFIGNFQGTYV